MRHFLALGLLLGSCLVFGQEPDEKPEPAKKQLPHAVGPNGSVFGPPVSEAEAFAVLKAVEDAMADAAHLNRLAAPKLNPRATTPVDREALLDELARIDDGLSAAYKLTPRQQYLDERLIKVSIKRRGEALHLVRTGFLDTLSPILVGPGKNLTVEQFAIAIGFFIARFADRSHLPSIEWSPYLQVDPEATRAPVKPGSQPSRPAPKPSAPGPHPV
jgi:hypothetical protein